MFICAPCHNRAYGGPGLHNESRGTCEVCTKIAKCVDCSGHAPRRAGDPRIQTVPVTSVPPARTSPAVANSAGKTATPRSGVIASCAHCGEKILMNRGTDYWLHDRTRAEECGP